MENLQDIKALWAELNSRLEVLEADNRRMARRMISAKYKSARDKLISKYKTFIFIEIIMIIYIGLFILNSDYLVERYKTITLIYWIVFFFGEICIDFYLLCRIEKIDVYSMTVRDISSRAALNWKIHKMAIIVGLPIAFGAIILFGLLINANKFVIYGMIVGGIVGAIIGLTQLRKIMKYYRLLQSNEE